jgi:hypothetical protein
MEGAPGPEEHLQSRLELTGVPVELDQLCAGTAAILVN